MYLPQTPTNRQLQSNNRNTQDKNKSRTKRHALSKQQARYSAISDGASVSSGLHTFSVTLTRYHQQQQLQVLRSVLRVGIIVDMNRKNKTAK
jgi:hypothetical protein